MGTIAELSRLANFRWDIATVNRGVVMDSIHRFGLAFGHRGLTKTSAGSILTTIEDKGHISIGFETTDSNVGPPYIRCNNSQSYLLYPESVGGSQLAETTYEPLVHRLQVTLLTEMLAASTPASNSHPQSGRFRRDSGRTASPFLCYSCSVQITEKLVLLSVEDVQEAKILQWYIYPLLIGITSRYS